MNVFEQYVDEFKQVAKEFTKEATSSKSKAMQVLIDSGIYNKDGSLNERFR